MSMTNDTSEAVVGRPLTRREKEICDSLVLGLMSKEIAIKLEISCRTVEDHRKHILKKFGVRNAVELTRKVYGIKEFGPESTQMEPAE